MEFLWLLCLIPAAVLGYVLFLAVCSLFIDPRREYEDHSGFYRCLLNQVTWLAMRIMRVRVHVTGGQKLPADTKKLLFVGNHRANFDPIVTWYAFRDRRLAFISKPANFKIPVFGRYVHRCCFMPIDRENPRNAIKTIIRAARLLEGGQLAVGVYPEGTRSKSCKLLPFHNGVFKIAQKASAPVVVVSVEGTEQVRKNWPLRSTRVELEVLEVLDSDWVRENKTDLIGQRVRTLLLEKLGQ